MTTARTRRWSSSVSGRLSLVTSPADFFSEANIGGIIAAVSVMVILNLLTTRPTLSPLWSAPASRPSATAAAMRRSPGESGR